MGHTGRWNVLFRPAGDASVDTMPPFHVFVVVRPVREVVLTLVARIWTFSWKFWNYFVTTMSFMVWLRLRFS